MFLYFRKQWEKGRENKILPFIKALLQVKKDIRFTRGIDTNFVVLFKGDQILEWNHRSMVDVSFEQVRSIIADSPEEVNLVVCHNTTR